VIGSTAERSSTRLFQRPAILTVHELSVDLYASCLNVDEAKAMEEVSTGEDFRRDCMIRESTIIPDVSLDQETTCNGY
jgi:hypothetical protein